VKNLKKPSVGALLYSTLLYNKFPTIAKAKKKKEKEEEKSQKRAAAAADKRLSDTPTN